MTPLAASDQGAAVTPADGADLPEGRCEWIYVGVSGDIVATVGGTDLTFKAAPVGPLWVRATRIKATGTTATNLIAMY